MGKGGDTATGVQGAELRQRAGKKPTSAAGAAEKVEMLIDGNMVDVTSVMKKHPGGSIIKFYSGTDASEAFHEFHHRSDRAKKWLKSLPKRDVNVPKDPLVADYIKLRADFEREGFFEPQPLHVVYRVAEIVAMHAVGLYFALSGGWMLPVGIAILGVAQGRCGWLMHEGGHHSATGSIRWDIPMQVFFYGFGCGMSAAFWRNQHNKHHATPQKLKHDVDLDTLPLISFNKAVTKLRPRLVNKTWLKYQSELFAPVTCLIVALGWQFFLHPRHSIRTKRFHEVACMAARYVAWAYTFGSVYGTGPAIALYLAYVWVGAAYIFVNFAVSHTHKPVVGADEHKDWVRYAAEHTTNIQDSWWCNWWMGYLNFQIEHHLFPAMPQVRHPEISPRVKALFEKHGVEYDVRSYPQAVKDTFANLADVGSDAWYG